MTTKEIDQMELEQIIDKHSFVRRELLSFLFGGRDYDLEYKYDQFYKKIKLSSIIANFEHCYKAENICEMVVQISEMCLLLVPDSMKNEGMCNAAIDRCPHLIAAVPRSLITYEMAKNATRRDCGTITYVPEHLLDYKMYTLLVRDSGSYVLRVPEIYRDYDMFLLAVNSEPAIFVSVPEHFKTDAMIQAAIRNPRMFQHVPIEKRTRILCLRMVKRKGEMLVHVPVEMRDIEICMAAAFQSDYIFFSQLYKHFPYKVFTQEICDQIMGIRIAYIKFCPIQFIRPHHYEKALLCNHLRYQEIPDHMKTITTSAIFVKKGGDLSLVPPRFRTMFILL